MAFGWNQIATFPSAFDAFPYGATFVERADGKLWMSDPSDLAIAVYDPVADSWASKPWTTPASSSGTFSGSSWLYNDTIYMVGTTTDGYNALYSYADDVGGNLNLISKWTAYTSTEILLNAYPAQSPIVGSTAWMPVHSFQGAGLPGSGAISPSGLASYDHVTNAWNWYNPPTPYQGVYTLGMPLLSDGSYIYWVEGETQVAGTFSSQNVIYRFDIATSTWDTLTTEPSVGPGRGAPGAILLNNKIYLFGGLRTDTNTDFTSVSVYDLTTNAWSTETAFPDGREGAMAALLGTDALYVVNGFDDATNATVFTGYQTPLTGGAPFPFTDDFTRADSTTLGDPWKQATSGAPATTTSWDVVGAQAALDSATTGIAIAYLPVRHADVRVSALLVVTTPTSGIAFRIADDLNSYWFVTRIGLYYFNAGTTTTVATWPTVVDGTIVMVRAYLDTIQVYANNALLTAHTSTNNQTATSHGILVNAADGFTARWDHVVITRAYDAPVIDAVNPSSGVAGEQVNILGANLDSVTSVTFGSVPASFTIDGSADLFTTAPLGDGSLITVSGPGGQATASFTYQELSGSIQAVQGAGRYFARGRI